MVADRPWQRTDRPGGVADRAGHRGAPGPGGAALAYRTGRCGVPQVDAPTADKENFEIFDFEINDEEIEALTALDRGEKGRQGPHPDVFDWIG